MRRTTETRRVDAVVVGAGFAGLYLVRRMTELGLSVLGFESAPTVGGTWYWNRYPGARCDVESLDYSYSWSPELQQDWEWSERYPAQPEILAYLEHVADRFDLRRHFRFETCVESATFDQDSATWTIRTDDGTATVARFCIMATGMLSSPKPIAVPGTDEFAGEVLQSSQWPEREVDFTDRRVGVVGTGSTGIQIIPAVAQDAASVTVFQRTPTYSIPARNHPLDDETQAEVKRHYEERRERARWTTAGVIHEENDQSAVDVTPKEREREYAARWAKGGSGFMRAFNDIMTNERANATAAQFVRDRIDDIVDDPETAELLKPRDFPIGARRIALDTDYYRTYNLDHVRLVDARKTPIERLTACGVRTTDEDIPLDVIIFATGFDAMTGALSKIDIIGRDGQTLREAWQDGPVTYLGIAVAGFPNLFVITGPGSPSVLGNMVNSIEQHVEWVADAIAYLEEQGFRTIEAEPEAQREWVEHVNEIADGTLYPQARSWYTGANVPGKPRVFMPYVGGVGAYRRICDEVAAKGYEGFRLSSAATEPEHWRTVVGGRPAGGDFA